MTMKVSGKIMGYFKYILLSELPLGSDKKYITYYDIRKEAVVAVVPVRTLDEFDFEEVTQDGYATNG